MLDHLDGLIICEHTRWATAASRSGWLIVSDDMSLSVALALGAQPGLCATARVSTRTLKAGRILRYMDPLSPILVKVKTSNFFCSV